jgi:hypothetical protein
MGTTFVDSAACPRGTVPPCRTSILWACGHQPQHLRYARSEVVVADAAAANMVQDDSKSMSQHREIDRDRPLSLAQSALKLV